MKKILSFCTTCKNRFWQLKRTLPRNLKDNVAWRSRIEFVIVDFSSDDGTGAWIKRNFKRELKEGYLKYYFTEGLPSWHASIAKNTAHLFATGQILVNLDCDNFTGWNGAYFVISCFNRQSVPIVIHQFRGDGMDGSFGRICVSKDIFSSIGGYDEELHPMGYQDMDLLARLRMNGVKYVNIKNTNFNNAIRNTKEQSIALCNTGMSYMDMLIKNRDISFSKLSVAKNPVRNGGMYGLRNNVLNHRNETAIPEIRNSCFDQIVARYQLEPVQDSSSLLRDIYGL